MALNPIVYTEKIVRSFLRYQLTSYPFADERLHAQMRRLLSLDETRDSPLLKGPFISLSRPFREGASVDDLVGEGVFHPHMRHRIPAEIDHVYAHQEQAIRAIHGGQTTLVSTGTGSGKTECFLYPIVSRCMELKDENAPAGISAVIVYPMNALAEDQLWRLRSLLAGTGISFGMYVGKTPERDNQVTGIHLPSGSSRADYETKLAEIRREKRSDAVYPPEEVCSREIMRTPGRQPRILLTNVKQLELLLTRQRDIELFSEARLDFLVFDEAHTFTGAQGAETACLIRRLRSYCGRRAQDSVCVATSATIVDQKDPNAAKTFASRFFGVNPDDVVTVGESYEADVWAEGRTIPPAPANDTSQILNDCVRAVESALEDDSSVRAVYRDLSSAALPAGEWPRTLYAALSNNELVFQLSELLSMPQPLHELPAQLEKKIGRAPAEAEILAWLTIGAAARDDGRPLVRPVVHGFIRGISGAVVSFPFTGSDARLWLAAEDEIGAGNGSTQHAHFPVTTCTTCGQHYLISFLKDFEFTGKAPSGGEASLEGSYWEPLDEAHGGKRVVLVDRIVGGTEDEDLDENDRTSALHFCRHCGTAHPDAVSRCLHCGASTESVSLYAIRQNRENPGYLTSCLCCGANGRVMGTNYREPARPVRATNVADVHVLAQDMVQNSERPRLLIFCDNRQDAAFQAGWMKDHARRFRLRALMAEGIESGPVSIGDLTLYLDDLLEKDEALSRALVPEVWQVVRKEGGGGRHEQERRKFLRIQVLREVTLSSRQAIGLEPWGRMKVEYEGLDAALPWIQINSHQLGLPPEDLRDGVASLLDYFRRKRVLHDPEREIFTKYWMDGDLEVQQGYLPQLGNPAGTKLRRGPNEKSQLVTQWLSDKGDTTIRQIARKWGVPIDSTEIFLEKLFEFLVQQGFLKPVQLKGSKGNPLPNVSGVYQVDADRVRLRPSRGVWRCQNCRRKFTRRTPQSKCLAWRCEGLLAYVREDPDNYDLQVLDQSYSMLRPEEHTAMVPHDERERLENLFKGDSDAINAFVCTPTLELGVDIGQLDAVLMRNVPPLPANYWQRAGRAGRRHRMAVDLTYCRPVSHDRAYFADPLKLLSGKIDPPAFNLRNDLMVAKHVHATVITRLHQYARDPVRSSAEREAIDRVLKSSLPDRISAYLFEDGLIRDTSFDFSLLQNLIQQNLEDLLLYIEGAFRQGWPEADADVTSGQALRNHLTEMVSSLALVVGRLRRRVQWAQTQIRRLNRLRESQGTLDQEDDALFRRCDRLMKRLKGTAVRQRREAEGYDDINTFGVLAAEGFLPGYGLEAGSVLGTAEIPFWRTGAMEFTLPRPASVALREYVPGNLIYANGNRFVARRFHRDIDEDRIEMPVFEISTERQAVKQTNLGSSASTLGAAVLETIAVCDVDLVHQSHISDEEEVRFQMGVSIFGLERDQHDGGTAFKWGERSLHKRRGVRMRLVNVGAASAITRFSRFGYPICTVCGLSVSPLSSDRQRETFQNAHKDRCGRKVQSVGFYADVVADAISLPACEDQTTAYSVFEAIRFAATSVLDMHMDDLQILVIGHVDRAEVDAVLWDPMPGGSGLLDQLCERFDEIVAAAREVVQDCPSVCDTSCVDCLQTFRNGYYHKHLNRKIAIERLDAWGPRLTVSHEIPPKQPSQEPNEGTHPVNEVERKLRHLLLAAGFEEGLRGQQIRLDRTIGTTTPDVIYRAAHHSDDEGICIYLDGLAGHIHGNRETAEQDQLIRGWLRNNDYETIEIPASDLDDEKAMTRHFRKLAGYLQENVLRESLRSDSSWFAKGQPKEVQRFSLRLVQPKADERYVSCVPFVTLKAAAGALEDPRFFEKTDFDWVEVDASRGLRSGMFVAQVAGHSMEPSIPDGSYCLFSEPGIGSRQGKTVLVELLDAIDSETGETYTVKRYYSEKAETDETWRHVKITLKPNNPDFDAIEFTCEDEGRLRVIAELVEVLG
jgi:ATP-dependent helicase YprA (DUF1998 family)/SOS-response transcriptional repressor LexA